VGTKSVSPFPINPQLKLSLRGLARGEIESLSILFHRFSSNMAKRVSVDRWMFTVTAILVFVGLVMIFSASAVMAKERFGSAYEFLLKQLVFAVAGFTAMILAMKVDYKRLQHPALVFSFLGATSLLLVSVFFLDRAHGTHRWFHVGPVSLQPSELAKPALILFLAWFLQNKTKSMDDWRNTLLPAVAPTMVFLGLIVFQPDLGTAIACAGITACVLFVAGIRLRWFGYAILAAALPLYFLIFHVAYRRDRILAFWNPYADPKGFGFHIIQSLIAVATGGVTGLGLMEGKQKLFYLPEPHTDFIFAVTAEELGLVGALAVIVLFAIFLWRGTRAALRTQDNFGRFLAVGITSMIVLQAFINISVVLGLMPTKGIPLPFVSYGGSSLFVTLMCVGVLLNITKQAE
jgi:cell division protein FtsW